MLDSLALESTPASRLAQPEVNFVGASAVPLRTGTLPSGASASQSRYPSLIMYCTKSFDAALAPSVITNEVISPYCAGPFPIGPDSAETMPVFLARYCLSERHSLQVGRASLRSPASSSRMYEDQTVIAVLPAK